MSAWASRPDGRLILAIVASFAVHCAALAQSTTTLYKSTGPDGKTVYSDRPPAEAKQAKTLTFQTAPATPLSAETLAYLDQLGTSANARAVAAPLPGETTLFSAVWCGYCKQAKAYLASKQIAYREIDIGTKEGLAAFARAGGGRGVPLLVAGGARVSGFSVASYDSVFRTRK